MEKEENDEGVFEDEFDSDTVNGAKLTTSNVPWPGSTFIIRRALSEDTIMQVVLTGLDGWGSNYWACEQNKGWLGFRNPVSGKLLGHDGKGRLCCSADRHRDYEKFCVRQNPEGGYTLLMTHSSDLWRVGTALDGGLAKIEDSSPNEIIWEFVKVDQD